MSSFERYFREVRLKHQIMKSLKLKFAFMQK